MMPETLSRIFIFSWLAAAMLLMAHLSMKNIGGYYYNPDESLCLHMALGQDAAQVLRFSLNETHPPLFWLMLHYWIALTGSPDHARSLSLFLGLLLVPVHYALGRQVGGRFAGLCCATLIALSTAVLVQSSVVRNYTGLLLFLSLAFYFLLRWHERQQPRMLLAYAAMAIMACATHFLALLGILSICAAETIYSLVARPLPRKTLFYFLLTHLTVVLMFLPLYYCWLPTLAFFGPGIALHAPRDLLRQSLFSPLSITLYLLPCLILPRVFMASCEGIMLLSAEGMRKSGIRFLYLLLAVAFSAMIAFYLSGFYHVDAYATEERHNLWIVPFMLPLIGIKFAAVAGRKGKTSSGTRLTFHQAKIACLLLIAGFFLYNQPRKLDSGEYAITQSAHQQLSDYIHGLRPNTLVVADRNSAFILAQDGMNPYLGMSHGGWDDGAMARILPEGHTRMLVDTAHLRFYTKRDVSNLMAYAGSQHLLSGVDTLVFFKNVERWAAPALTELNRCRLPDVKTVTLDENARNQDAAQLIIVPLARMKALLAAKQDRFCPDEENKKR